MSLTETIQKLRSAQRTLALQNRDRKDSALKAVMKAIEADRAAIQSANALDVQKAQAGGMSAALVERLLLDAAKIDGIIAGIGDIIRLEDPIGRVKAGWRTPNGLLIEQFTVPLGIAAIIYESRPNVTVDAFSLAYKAGCGILLRGSSAALESNYALVLAIKKGLESGGGVPDAVFLAVSSNHDDIDEILQARGLIDVVLPRGGKELIRRVVKNARVPVIETGEGNCHIFVDAGADLDAALSIIENAKLQRPGACNAVETVLLHKDIVGDFAPKLAARLAGKAELRCDEIIRERIQRCAAGKPNLEAVFPGLLLKSADTDDWETEYLDCILALKTVHSVEEAITHINQYGSGHSEAILTNDLAAQDAFCRQVDAACVYSNASTRFSDGGQFGFGAELGISTQKFHARGPMGLEALTTIKYRIQGQGQWRK
ncbi:glutamate-5-semialdehyde dehydrogenase [Breznakiellaceae bacterium SP9]